jgi:Zn-dependent protease with chaperone function
MMADNYVYYWFVFVGLVGIAATEINHYFNKHAIKNKWLTIIQRALLIWFLASLIHFRTLGLTETSASTVFNVIGFILVSMLVVVVVSGFFKNQRK